MCIIANFEFFETIFKLVVILQCFIINNKVLSKLFERKNTFFFMVWKEKEQSLISILALQSENGSNIQFTQK